MDPGGVGGGRAPGLDAGVWARGGRTGGAAEEAAWAVRRADGRVGGRAAERKGERVEGMAGPD